MPSPPTFRKINPADFSILLLSVQSDALPLIEVNDYTDNFLAQQISQIEGVGLVNIFGQQKPAVRIQVDPDKLASMGLSLEDIRGVIATTTVNQPKGTIDGSRQSFTVYTNDQLLSAAPWNDMVLAYRNGSPIRVRDVGVAVPGPEDLKKAAWAFAGKAAPADDAMISGRSLIVGITKQPGANVIDTVERIKAALPQLLTSIPPSVHVSTLSDRTQNIRASVQEVEMTLLLSIGLVVGMIFIFLRNVPATLIPSATIPLSLLGTAAVMYLVGFSLDNLSLMALTIAVGFVVDDAIVMLENIYRHVEEGMAPMEAAYKGAVEIGPIIVSISVSLIAVSLVVVLGYCIARLGLRPLKKMSFEAQSLNAKTLSQRLYGQLLPEELDDLAVAFNGALGRLEAAYKQLEAFNADVAHELRTPLTNLIGETQVALSRPRTVAELQEVLQSNLEGLERLRSIVNDMLFLARADQGEAATGRVQSSVAAEVGKTIEFLELILDETHETIRVDGDTTAQAMIETSLFRRAMANLLQNAIEHSRSGAQIRVIIERQPARVRIGVANPGDPIGPAHLPRLFDRFYRVDGARYNGQRQGHGLGLAIVKAVATMHGGEVFAFCEGGITTIGFSVLSTPAVAEPAAG